jgi:dTDP-4-dehydrorhamnose reductase
MRVIVFGVKGFIGSALLKECSRRGIECKRGVRGTVWGVKEQLIGCDLAVNCAAYIPVPSVDACKDNPDETIFGNVVWPSILRDACRAYSTPMVHLSTACLFDEQREYSETDTPTRGWNGHCGMYVGSKKLSERVVAEYDRHYILRLRLPFDEFNNPRNYLRKLLSFTSVFEHTNSLSHRGDFAKAALDLWELRAPYGIYHVANPGFITASETLMKMQNRGIFGVQHRMVASETTGCTLSVKKLLDAGVKIRPVGEAVDDALKNWVE